VGEPDAYAGELPVAFVMLKRGVAIDPLALLQAVAPNVHERPAVPKRLTVLDAMPMTAIGKIYKPALRLRAVETKLAEMLAGVAPGRAVSVAGEEVAGTVTVTITVSGAPADEITDAVRERLTAIAVRTELVFST
jgi:fatty-acyl-CoA synthase